MKIENQDLWKVQANWRGITTNGELKADGCAVMGKGTAAQALERFPGLDYFLGLRLRKYGNRLFTFGYCGIFTFPTKHKWRYRSNFTLIRQSVAELTVIANNNPNHIYVIPLPGTGAGGLSPSKIWPLLEPLPDNVIIATGKP